mgnify:CR=1 FL=1
MDNDKKLRNQLVKLLKQGNAFMPLSDQLNSFPYENTGVRLEGFAHTIWELTEHIRLALHDLVEYAKDSYYQSPPWPDGYWPENPAPDSRKEWAESTEHIDTLLNEIISMVQNTSNDLFESFKANADHNLLRQATIAAEHAAYHAGQIAMINKALQRLQE